MLRFLNDGDKDVRPTKKSQHSGGSGKKSALKRREVFEPRTEGSGDLQLQNEL
jgi:hypothetical protein